MTPTTVAVLLGCTFLVTTRIYFFGTPDELKATGAQAGKLHATEGRYGKHDAEFNWCEVDYATTPYVAELWNTLTSLLYCVEAVLLLHLHGARVIARVPYARVILGAVFATGVGSTLFHATLRYDMQLLDELPMYALAVAAACALLARADLSNQGSAATTAARAAQAAAHDAAGGRVTYKLGAVDVMRSYLVALSDDGGPDEYRRRHVLDLASSAAGAAGAAWSGSREAHKAAASASADVLRATIAQVEAHQDAEGEEAAARGAGLRAASAGCTYVEFVEAIFQLSLLRFRGPAFLPDPGEPGDYFDAADEAAAAGSEAEEGKAGGGGKNTRETKEVSAAQALEYGIQLIEVCCV